MSDLDDLLDSFDDEAGFTPETGPAEPGPGKRRQAPWSKFSEGIAIDPPKTPTGSSAPHLLAVYQNVRCTHCGTLGAAQFVGLFVGKTTYFIGTSVEHLEAYQPTKHDKLKLPRDFSFLERYQEVPVCFSCMTDWRDRGPAS